MTPNRNTLSGAGQEQPAPLRILRISPSGDHVPPSQEAVIQFDQKMVPLGHMGRAAGTLPVTIRPDPGCQWRWLDTTTLACRLPGQQHFAPATRYTVTIGAGIQALDGSRLAGTVTQTFTTQRARVEWTDFREWRSPVMPVFMVHLNLPVTAQQLAGHLAFVSDKGKRVDARVEPFTEKREGPIWLPVPGRPGAVVKIEDPQPEMPLDVHANAMQGRRVWQIRPVRPLAPSTRYVLRVSPGLHTPLGPLGGTQNERVEKLVTYGEFTFSGIECVVKDHGQVILLSTNVGHLCRPEIVSLLFSAPVPRATLQGIRWNPLPLPKAKLNRAWANYAQWRLRMPGYATDAAGHSGYPLPFDLKPWRLYTLTVPAGVRDRFGRTLDETVRMTFAVGHRTPFMDPPPDTVVLEAGQPTIVPLRFTNLKRLTFDYRVLTASDLRADQGADSHHRLHLLERESLQAPKDEIVSGSLGIRGILHGQSGVIWGALNWSPDAPHDPYRFIGEITPWQMLVKVGLFETLVWVSDFATGEPVAGARVRLLRGRDHKLRALTTIAVATTNAHGLATLPGSATLPESWFQPWEGEARFYVAATRNDTMALMRLDDDFDRSIFSASHYTVWANNEPPLGHMRVWAVTAQGIYKPGSDVHYTVFARAVAKTTLEAPPRQGYTLTITGPLGNTLVKREDVTLSAYGQTSGTIHIAATKPMGWYEITLGWPTKTGDERRRAGRFLVTDFVPAAFKVRTTLKGQRFAPGDTVTARVHATLHAGGPYTGAKVKFTTRLVPTVFSPDTPLAAGFSFGGANTLPDATTIAVLHDKLDMTGRAQLSVTLPADSSVIHGVVEVLASVQSTRGTSVADAASLPYTARDRFIGLRTADWMQTAGEPFAVEYLVVNPSGRPASGARVVLELQRKTIRRIHVKNGAGEFTEEEHVIWVTEDRCRAVSTNAPGRCELTPEQAGSYRVQAHVLDTHGRTQSSTLHTWVTGAGAVVWSHSDEAVTLVPDKSAYHVGDTAHVLIQNPYPGAKALITVERYSVLWKKVVTLEGSAPVIDVPITAAAFPGAYLSVTIFSPRVSPPADPDLGRPEVALGYVALKVVGKGSSLDVRVTPAEDEYKPGQTVQVDVRVDTKDGGPPGRTRLVVAVVDQGVLDLLKTGTDYYDPRAAFYAPPRGPDMVNYSLARRLLTLLQSKSGKGETQGGGGGPGSVPDVRSNFRYTAYWNPALETDAAGRAHFRFKLPDNLTRWRILVIAMRPGAKMGLGIDDVRVNLPLQIKPALPNQVHVGDHFGAAFNVTNRTQRRLQVTTRIAASGAILAYGQATSQSRLTLAPFEHGLSWLDLYAAEPGRIDLTAMAQAGALGDAVAAHIPVTRAGTEVTAAEYGSIVDAGVTVPIKLPANALAGTANVSVTFAPTLVGGLDAAFAVMRDNPLRTWETMLSRAVLAADYLRLKPALGDSVQWPGAADVVEHALTSAAAFQGPEGGMAFWVPREDFVSPYLSVYTALAFHWLRSAGYTPPASVSKALAHYLRNQILARKGEERAAPVLRAGAMAALALSPHGDLEQGAVAGMLAELPGMRLFGQALLLQAAIATGDRTSADVIVRSLFNHAAESAGLISFNERVGGAYVDLLATPLRANCAILDALARYKLAWGSDNLLGKTPLKLMRWVTSRREESGAWANSQENVFCATAIMHYAAAYESQVDGLTGTLKLPGQKAESVKFASRAAPAVRLAGPVTQPGERQRVTLGRDGKGRLYYSVQLHYAMPPGALAAASAGMTLSRHYYVKRGGDWQPVTDETVLERGDTVRVDLVVDVPTERHHVVLTDPLPGAFQAVNRRLATAPKLLPHKQPGVAILMFDGGSWPNLSVVTGGFYHREMGFQAVRFFAENLPAGRYRLVYAAQVIAPGRFIAPAPTIREIYHPDIFGRGEAQHLTVAGPDWSDFAPPKAGGGRNRLAYPKP